MAYGVSSNMLQRRFSVFSGGNVQATGTLTTSANSESDVVAGGSTLILSLTAHTLVSAGANFDAQRQNIIDGITGDYPTTGWATVTTALAVTDVARTDDTTITITLPAVAGYSIGLDETVTIAIPSTATVEGEAPSVVTISVARDAVAATIHATSTINSKDESEIRDATGYTILIDITGEIWVASGATFDAQRQNIIDGISGDDTVGFGWDAEVQANMAVTDVARTSDTRCTVTVAQQTGYYVPAAENITIVLPATAIASHDSAVTVSTALSIADVVPTMAISGTLDGGNETDVHSSGTTLILTLTNGNWNSTVGADNAVTTALLAGIVGDDTGSQGWNSTVGAGLDYNDVTRDSGTQVTILLNDAYPLYGIASNETLTITVPASAVDGQSAALAADTTVLTAQTATVAVTGTLSSEVEVVAGSETIILTLSLGTWDSTVGADNAVTTALLAGITGDDGTGTGWDAVATPLITYAHVVRTSDTVVTITPPAVSTYSVAADETLTIVVPASAVNGNTAALASDTLTISEGAGVFDSWDLMVGTGEEETSIDSAIGTASTNTVWVKAETYVENLTFDVADQYFYFEPGTVITGTIDITAADVCLEFGTGCSISGLITWSGANGRLLGRNGLVLTGGINNSFGGDNFHFDGGGWGTSSKKEVFFDSIDSIFQNFSIDTKTGGSGNNSFRTSTTAKQWAILSILAPLSDSTFIFSNQANSTDCILMGCTISDSDGEGIWMNAPKTRVIGNYSLSSGVTGITLKGSADNSVICANLVKDATTSPIEMVLNSDNCVAVGNRADGALVDSASGTTLGGNDETAF